MENILEKWKIAEDAGLVRLVAEPENQNYFDVYGDPETQNKEIIMLEIEANGCWFYQSQYLSQDDGTWQTAYSIGMVIGSLEGEGYYELDAKSAALKNVFAPID